MGSVVYGAGEVRYRVDGFIGRGAFGESYRILSDDGHAYALKVVSGLSQDDELEALLNEARMAPLIDHPNVIRIYYFHDGRRRQALPPYLILDYADGGSLQDVIDDRRKAGAHFAIEHLYAMLGQLAGGMKAINEVMIHGDIKPDNILVHGGTLKLSDFGLSRLIGAAGPKTADRCLQHVGYLPPEAWEHREITVQADIYSMGIVFYELATLRHPYDAVPGGGPVISWRDAHLNGRVVSPEKINPALPVSLALIIGRMLAKLPEDRCAAWNEVVECLHSA